MDGRCRREVGRTSTTDASQTRHDLSSMVQPSFIHGVPDFSRPLATLFERKSAVAVARYIEARGQIFH
jgi:hypothetical protein